jgi:hypothetical protein
MQGLLKGNRPDLTPAQLVGIVPVLAALLSAFGVYDLNPSQQKALEDAIQYGLVLVAGDAALRIGRSVSDSKRDQAALLANAESAPDVAHPDAPVESPLTDDELAAVADEEVDGVREHELPSDAVEEREPPPGG